MFQVQPAKGKERSPATRTVPKAKPRRELHPYSHIGASLSEFGPGAARYRQHLAGLQSMIGNQAVLRMLSSSKPVIQTKLAVNQPGDHFEREADRVAEHVMSTKPAPIVQRSCSSGEGEEKLQRKCATCEEDEKLKRKSAGPISAPTVPPIVHDVLRSPGQPLDASARSYMEARFQTDFSRVRVHTDARASESARAVNAFAYTVGRNLVFASGQYQPASSGGMRLLAHELAHVVQQRRSISAVDAKEVEPFGTSLEAEAERAAEHIVGAGRRTAGALSPAPPSVQRAGPACVPRTGMTEYGCYCGAGSSCSAGLTCPPVDSLDTCCQAHDGCYDACPGCTFSDSVNPLSHNHAAARSCDRALCNCARGLTLTGRAASYRDHMLTLFRC